MASFENKLDSENEYEESEEIEEDEINLDNSNSHSFINLDELNQSPIKNDNHSQIAINEKSPLKNEKKFEENVISPPAETKYNSLISPNKNVNKKYFLDIDYQEENIVNYLLYHPDLMEAKKESIQNKLNKRYNNIKSSFHNKSAFINSYDAKFPESISDFKTAQLNILKNNKEKSQVKKLLAYKSDPEDIQRKLESVQTSKIQEKVDNYLKRRENFIKMLEDRISQEFTNNHTFSPKTNMNKTENLNFSFSDFIDRQKKFDGKVTSKIKNLKAQHEKKSVTSKDLGISENSKKIYDQKFRKKDVSIYERLYSLNLEKDNIINDEKNCPKKLLSAQYISQLVNRLYSECLSKPNKIKEIEADMNKEFKEQLKSYSSNTIILKHFIQLYKNELINLNSPKQTHTIDKSSNVSVSKTLNDNEENHTEFTSHVNDFNNTTSNQDKEINDLYLNIYQLNTLLINLNFISPEKDNKSSMIMNFKESSLKLREKKLVYEIFENLKNSQNLVSQKNLFIFLLSILNLYESYLLKMNKNRFNKKEIIKILFDSKKQKIDEKKLTLENENKINNYILNKINLEITEKITKNHKFCSYDSNGNFYILLPQSQKICKNFSLFSLSWIFNYQDIKNQKKDLKVQKSRPKSYSNLVFQPKISEKSKNLGLIKRKKIQSELETYLGRFNDENKIFHTEKFDLNYIKMLLLKKQKDEKALALKKETQENKILLSCTFKPSLINESTDQSLNREGGVFDNLYKKGLAKVSKKNDRNKDLIEYEKAKNNCIFKPQLEKPISVKNNYPSEMKFQQKEYVKQFKRLENGRKEREMKELIHSRRSFLKKEVLNSKETFNLKKQSTSKGKKEILNKSANNNIKGVNIEEKIIKPQLLKTKTSIEQEPNSIRKEEKKESLPLLIIDVNVSAGEKKKIYVFDGDTANELAEKFSNENKLDIITKNKLKFLIENQMSKLLMRIEEENITSRSEISMQKLF